MFEIRRYTPDDRQLWDDYVACARNATFLFLRGYMDYHRSRFDDYSLLFFKEGRLHSVLPANIVGDTLYSHQGLTFGGLLMDAHSTAADVNRLFGELNIYLRQQGIRRVVYKPVPRVYHRQPSEEDLYPIFWTCKARLVQRDIGTAIPLGAPLSWRKGRKAMVSRARNAGVRVEATSNLAPFWQVLDENLATRHGARPVHSVQEMQMLRDRFPDHIIQYQALLSDTVIAGATLFVTGQVAHIQYCASTEMGKRLGGVDAVYDRIIRHDFAHLPWVDFGRSTEGDGSILNEGLVAQKEGFGGRTVCYDTYEWDTSAPS